MLRKAEVSHKAEKSTVASVWTWNTSKIEPAKTRQAKNLKRQNKILNKVNKTELSEQQ